MGLPTATQVMFKSDPAMTLYSGSGGMENLGFTRRTKVRKSREIHKTVNIYLYYTYDRHYNVIYLPRTYNFAS